jgi:undecaprenyl diphosphate synthase
LIKKLLGDIESLELKTKNFNSIKLNVCFYYTGRWDIINSINNAINLAKKGESSYFKIEDIESNLSLSEIDLCIRVGNEKRISNFAIWQLSYAELFFSSTLWPDFTIEEFEEILKDYKKRNRRFGK